MSTEILTPRLYIASLSDYNNGYLRGEWFDLEDYADNGELLQAIYDMLRRFDEEYGIEDGVPREEYAVHDYEDVPQTYYSEYMGFEDVLAYVHATSLWSAERREALGCWLENSSSNTLEDFDSHYLGYYGADHAYDDDKTAANYAEETTDISDVPAHIKDYIDFESMARDWVLSGDIWVSRGHVFTS